MLIVIIRFIVLVGWAYMLFRLFTFNRSHNKLEDMLVTDKIGFILSAISIFTSSNMFFRVMYVILTVFYLVSIRQLSKKR